MSAERESRASLLRIGVRINAVLSLLMGVLFVVAASAIADVIRLDIDYWIVVFGFVLIGHAVALVLIQKTSNLVRWTWVNLAIIAPYSLVMISLAIAVVEPADGKMLVALDGILVGAVAVLQFLGIRSAAAPKRELKRSS
ncbi:hypothetical protein AB0O87_11390 [Microbacterium sp. NPDC076768]|uniref:hypothetical protein n=1 Tax=Microbacterium sp. NPDC076768 TaxID=3154858 RepID=UPI003436C57C